VVTSVILYKIKTAPYKHHNDRFEVFQKSQDLSTEKMSEIQTWKKRAISFSLVALCLVVYWHLPANDFIILDDPHYITANTQIQKGPSVDFILWAFTDTDLGLRIPLTWISLMVDYQLYGPWYPGFAFSNLLLHSLNSVILFFLLMKMTTAVWRSAFVAALFAVHPLHVESVAWMTNRKDVLYALIWFLAIWVYVDWTRKPVKIRYGLLVALFAAACLAKPMAITLPVLLLIIDYWPLQRFACPCKGEGSSSGDKYSCRGGHASCQPHRRRDAQSGDHIPDCTVPKCLFGLCRVFG